MEPSVARARAAELRALGARHAERHRAARIGGVADVVVVRGGASPEGLTEDYLDVALEPGATRGSRFAATLAADGSRLRAEAIT